MKVRRPRRGIGVPLLVWAGLIAAAAVISPATAEATHPTPSSPGNPTATPGATYVHLKLATAGLCLVRSGTAVELGSCTTTVASDRRWRWDTASTNRFLLDGTSSCLRPTAVAHAASVVTGSCRGSSGSSEYWKVTRRSAGEYTIEQHNTAGRCLDTFHAQADPGTDAVIGSCTAGSAHKWFIEPVS